MRSTSGEMIVTQAIMMLSGLLFLLILINLAKGPVFFVLYGPTIRKGVEARGGTLESVRFSFFGHLSGYRVTYRTKDGDRRVVTCFARGFIARFAADDRPAPAPKHLARLLMSTNRPSLIERARFWNTNPTPRMTLAGSSV